MYNIVNTETEQILYNNNYIYTITNIKDYIRQGTISPSDFINLKLTHYFKKYKNIPLIVIVKELTKEDIPIEITNLHNLISVPYIHDKCLIAEAINQHPLIEETSVTSQIEFKYRNEIYYFKLENSLLNVMKEFDTKGISDEGTIYISPETKTAWYLPKEI